MGNCGQLESGLALPYKGTIGAFGNAPAAGPPTNAIGPICGTSDLPHATVGNKLHIPIDVDGGLFSLGDVHARQGDGEVVGAPEICARVTVRFSVSRWGPNARSFCSPRNVVRNRQGAP